MSLNFQGAVNELLNFSYDADRALSLFLSCVETSGLTLYPAQEEAILNIFSGQNVILNTPTGSGKSLVATALHFSSLVKKNTSYYTSPIKALVNEKFLNLCRVFGAERVGMITGDASVNPGAPIICCTAEILSNLALRGGANCGVQDVVIDEFHFYSDKERGVAWQLPLLILNKSRFLLMSATMGNSAFFKVVLTDLTKLETSIVESKDRPVPLTFEYRETHISQTILDCVESRRTPIYLVNFSQRAAAEEAQNLLSVDLLSKEEKSKITELLREEKFASPYGKEFQKLLKHGVGIHHAGLLPRYRVLVEKLAQKGLLTVISGTDTLGVGVNVPIRSVVFTQLCKYDGEKSAILSARDFHQISGRAGRKGFDTEGFVLAQAPAHVIENLKMEQKAGGDKAKLRKIVKKKPPEFGYVPWDKQTFNRLINSSPEDLKSRFQVDHSMILNVMARPDGGYRELKRLIRSCHDEKKAKINHRKRAFQLFRSLWERKIITKSGSQFEIHVDLQEDFSIHHALALYLIDTVKNLDPTLPTFTLDVLTLCESIVEDPEVILRKQLDRVKTEKMAEMKMAGLEYEERMEELEKLEYPKPNRDFIYTTFNQFSDKHPWVGQNNISPKSVAREMFETYSSFADYVRDYDLERSEGVLLRYLSEVLKVLSQTVPVQIKNDELLEIEVFLENAIKKTDSSLIEEWLKLSNRALPEEIVLQQSGPSEGKDQSRSVTVTSRLGSIHLRNHVFQFVKSLASKDWEASAGLIKAKKSDSQENWKPDDIESLMKNYFKDYSGPLTDSKARAKDFYQLKSDSSSQRFEIIQTLTDRDEKNDWEIVFSIPLNTEITDLSSDLELVRISPATY